MEFQGTITGENGLALGKLASVQAELRLLFPGIVFEWSPSGIEKLADIDARRAEMPAIVRRSLESQPSFLCGSILGDGPLTVTFNIGVGDVVDCIWATVCGNEDEVTAVLARLQTKPGWLVASSG